MSVNEFGIGLELPRQSDLDIAEVEVSKTKTSQR